MPSSNQPVKPAPFDMAPTAAPAARTTGGGSNRQGAWIGIALGVLLLLALAVFFWLPQQVSAPSTEPTAPDNATAQALPETAQAPPSATQNADATSNNEVADVEAAPWEEALQAKMRKKAQAVLEPLLDLQFALEEQGVKTWAPREFQTALDTAAAGDALYRKREFEAATARYEDALTSLQALKDSLPQRVQALLEDTNSAIEELDQARALKNLETVTLIDPGSNEAAQLRVRVDQLPQVLELFSTAASAETARDLAAAKKAMAAVTKLDPEHERAQQEWQRLSAALEEQQFKDAMSRGYVALADNRLTDARAAFRAAASLRPDSTEARNALVQAGTADTDARLAQLQREGEQLEQREKWPQAVSIYEKALALDDTVLFANEGLARSRPRAELDRDLRQILNEPMRLSNRTVAETTAELLRKAQTLSPAGPVLTAQIAQLEDALHKANTPVEVTLLSDMQTEVTVYKIARLGRFQQHLLQLRPGTYTAVGSRIGYRDVRESFTIVPGAQPPTITIACTEPIQ